MRTVLRFVAALAAELVILSAAAASEGAGSSSDPYRRFEDPAQFAETAAWAREASRRFETEAEALPGYARLAAKEARVAAFDRIVSVEGDASAPWALTSRGRLRTRSGAVAAVPPLYAYAPAPSGGRVAYVASVGAEIASGVVADAAGRTLRRFGPLWGPASIAWVDGGKLLYSALPSAEAPFSDGWTLRMLDVDTGEDKPLFKAGEAYVAAIDLIAAERQPASPYVAILGRGGRSDMTVFVAETAALAAGEATLTKIAGLDAEICGFAARGRYAYAVSTRGAPAGKLLKLDLALREDALARAETLYVAAAGETIAASAQFGSPVAADKDGVYLRVSRSGGDALLYFADGAGTPRQTPTPKGASLSALKSAAGADGVFFVAETWFTAPTAWRAHGTSAPSLLFAAGARSSGDYISTSERATSADGAAVPMTILRKRTAHVDGARPAIVRAYASYGATTDRPRYEPSVFGWLDEGGVYATCGARGGGEKGRAWHRAGRADFKSNAQADVVACARRLAELGLTTPRLTALHTFSAGGLLAPLLFRDDRPFAAAAIEVGMLNPLRGGRNFDEIGDPRTDAGRRAVEAQDGLAALLRARVSPDLLVTCGLNDRRVQYWQPLKFAAAGMDRFGAAAHYAVLASDHGHASGQSNALIYAFFLSRFHAHGFSPPVVTASAGAATSRNGAPPP